jgi:hypothetical protein
MQGCMNGSVKRNRLKRLRESVIANRLRESDVNWLKITMTVVEINVINEGEQSKGRNQRE